MNVAVLSDVNYLRYGFLAAAKAGEDFAFNAPCGGSMFIPGSAFARWAATPATPELLEAARCCCPDCKTLSADSSIMDIIVEVLVPLLPVLIPVFMESISPKKVGPVAPDGPEINV